MGMLNIKYHQGVDLIRPLQEYEGKHYIATAVDYFTKFVEAKAISNKTAEEVGTFIYELFCQKASPII